MTVIRAEELLDRKTSRFDGVISLKRSSDYSLREFLSEVRGAKHVKLVEKIRNEEKKKKRDEFKTQLPAVTLSGLGNRKSKHDIDAPPFIHSGLLQIDLDLDDHPDWQVRKMFDVVNNDSHVLASFLSPSGGVKAVVPIEQNNQAHLNCFLNAEKHFSNLV